MNYVKSYHTNSEYDMCRWLTNNQNISIVGMCATRTNNLERFFVFYKEKDNSIKEEL